MIPMHQTPTPASVANQSSRRRQGPAKWWILAIAIAAFLLLVNVIGLFTSLRNPAIYHESLARSPVILTEQQLWDRINSFDGNSRAYATMITRAVHDGIAHYWEDAGINKYNLRVPFHENYLLNLASYVFPSRYRKYEFTNYKPAIQRGVGLCSQMAIIEVAVLAEAALPSRMVSLTKHVVLEGKVDGDRWWVLDPDYGATIPYSIEEIQRNPELVREPYRAAGVDERTTDMLVDIYTNERITVFAADGATPYHRNMEFVERASYVMIWAIPASVLLAFGVVTLRRRRVTSA
jgi:hypothetical protein